MGEKPKIERVEYENIENVIIWLENGGKIRYHRHEETGEIVQDTFMPDDPDSAWESTDVGREDENVRAFALDWIEWYTNAPVEEIDRDDFSRCVLGGEK